MPCWHAILLAAMATLVLLMPVSYRAGAEAAHPHAVFQVWIDSEHGGAHHHHAGEVDQGAAGGQAVGMPGDIADAEAVDAPTASAMKSPLQHATLLLALGGLWTLLVVGAQWRRFWAWSAPLHGCLLCPDPPPPRLLPLS